jgi:hypothetical protein
MGCAPTKPNQNRALGIGEPGRYPSAATAAGSDPLATPHDIPSPCAKPLSARRDSIVFFVDAGTTCQLLKGLGGLDGSATDEEGGDREANQLRTTTSSSLGTSRTYPMELHHHTWTPVGNLGDPRKEAI